jgi:hypothetical protein
VRTLIGGTADTIPVCAGPGLPVVQTPRIELLINQREYFPTIANNATDAEHDLDIGASRVWVNDGTDERLVDVSAATIAIDGAGLDTGTVANATWYYLWVFHNPTTGDSLYRLSASSTTPTPPSGYTFKRFLCDRIAAAVLTDSSALILTGSYSGRTFAYGAFLTELSGTVTTASSTLLTIGSPAFDCLTSVLVNSQSTDVSGSNILTLQHADTEKAAGQYRIQSANTVSPSFSTTVRTVASQIRYQVVNTSGTMLADILVTGWEVY